MCSLPIKVFTASVFDWLTTICENTGKVKSGGHILEGKPAKNSDYVFFLDSAELFLYVFFKSCPFLS